jgi:hypothetical protein
MTGFSDADFDDGCVMDELQARGFFEQIQDFAAALDSLIEHGDLDQWGESPATA